MATSPPAASAPSGGGGSGIVYGAVGVVFLLGAVAAVWFGLRGCGGPDASSEADAGANAGPSRTSRSDAAVAVVPNTQLADIPIDLDIAEDAGPTIVAAPGGGTKTKIVRVGGGGGSWDCSGEISIGEARRVAREYDAQARSCYERALRRNNMLAGTVVMTVRVGANGSVNAVRAGGSLSDGDVRSCVRGIANRWRFPAPRGGTCAIVQVPFNFRPRN